MKFYELIAQDFVLNSKEQAKIKGGTDDSKTTDFIVIGDIDVF